MENTDLEAVFLNPEEQALIEVVRKILWGSVEVKMRSGKIKVIKKTVETYVFDRDNKKPHVNPLEDSQPLNEGSRKPNS